MQNNVHYQINIKMLPNAHAVITNTNKCVAFNKVSANREVETE